MIREVLLLTWVGVLVGLFCPIEKLCDLRTAYYIQEDDVTQIILSNDSHCNTHRTSECIYVETHKKVLCSNIHKDGFFLQNVSNVLNSILIIASECYSSSHSLRYFVNKSKRSDFESKLIEVSSPLFGSIAGNILNVTVVVSTKQSNLVDFTVIGIINNTIPTSALSGSPLFGQNIEPASWFFILTPVRDKSFSNNPQESDEVTFFAMRDSDSLNDRRKSTVLQYGYPTYGYIEFVLSDLEIIQNRKFSYHEVSPVSSSRFSQQVEEPARNYSLSKEPLNVCIWSSIKMDGQKSIWLQQTRHMDRSRFHFVWILSLPEGGHLDAQAHPELLSNESVYKYLMNIQREQSSDPSAGRAVRVVDSPYNGFAIDRDDLFIAPGDGSPPAQDVWEGDVTRLYKFAHDRLVAAQFVIDRVTPRWCREFYLTMQTTLLAQRCDVVVFGNSRGFSSDVFITDTSRLLGIPSASELLNLYLDVDVLPDALVGPSTYAIQHHSVTSMEEIIASHRTQHQYAQLIMPSRIVISPSVDSETQFNPSRYRREEEPSLIAGGCEAFHSDGASSPCISVGFVARLSPEKSPGLFLMAAHELLQMYPFARFIMVGDGLLRESLENLAARLDIAWAVTFLGWVGGDGEELSRILRQIDVVVNPSLRAWSETFCIANIEAMSMQIPLVTFAVGGVGEYVENPALRADNSSKSQQFTVGLNAVVVNTATPQALARAVHHLIKHPELRLEIGRAGRRTVQQHFNIQRQMQQYEAFYEDLVTKKR